MYSVPCTASSFWISALFFSFMAWNRTILLSLEADTTYKISLQPNSSWCCAVLDLLLPLNTRISGKAVGNICHFSYKCYKSKTAESKITGRFYSPVLCSTFVESSGHRDSLHHLQSIFQGSFPLPKGFSSL